MSSEIYLYRDEFLQQLMNDIREGNLDKYKSWNFGSKSSDKILVPGLELESNIRLELPEKGNKKDLENSIIIYENFKNLTPSNANDGRLWSYLVHEKYYEYSRSRWPIDFNLPNDKLLSYIQAHYILRKTNTRALLDNSLARLWWIAYLTYDESSDYHYELTRELLSDLDYTRTLITGLLGRDNKFLRAFLKFAISSEWLNSNKEDKVRSLMKRMNFRAGSKVFGVLSEEEIIDYLNREASLLEKDPQW